MTTKETVREAIISANPDILKVEFGCIVKRALTDGGGTLATVLGIEKTGQIAYTSWAPFHANKTSVHHDWVNHLKIIGRPITLEDCILAIQKKVGDETGIDRLIESPPIVTRKREIVSRTIDTTGKLLEKWNLTKPYDDQSQELFDFLAKVLGVEEKI